MERRPHRRGQRRRPRRETIFILTTNAASRRIGEIADQTGETAEEQGRLAKAALADAQFAPEVLSRIQQTASAPSSNGRTLALAG